MSAIDVDEVFCTRSVDDIKLHIADVKAEIASTHNKLRSLVGERYRDLLHSSDVIQKMGSVCDDIIAIGGSGTNKASSSKSASDAAKAKTVTSVVVDVPAAAWSRVASCIPTVWSALDKQRYLDAAVTVYTCTQDVVKIQGLLAACDPAAVSPLARDSLGRWVCEISSLPATVISQCAHRVAVRPYTPRREQHMLGAFLVLQYLDTQSEDGAAPRVDVQVAVRQYLSAYEACYAMTSAPVASSSRSANNRNTTMSSNRIAAYVDMLVNVVNFMDSTFVLKCASLIPSGLPDSVVDVMHDVLRNSTALTPDVATQLCTDFVSSATKSILAALSCVFDDASTVKDVTAIVGELERHAATHTRTDLYDVSRWVTDLREAGAARIARLLDQQLQQFSGEFRRRLSEAATGGPRAGPEGNAHSHTSVRSYRLRASGASATQPTHIFDDALPEAAVASLRNLDLLHTLSTELSETQAFLASAQSPTLTEALARAVCSTCETLRDAPYPADPYVGGAVRQGIARGLEWYIVSTVMEGFLDQTHPEVVKAHEAVSRTHAYLEGQYTEGHMSWICETVDTEIAALKDGLAVMYVGPDRATFRNLHSTHWGTRQTFGETSMDVPVGPTSIAFRVLMSVSRRVCDATPSLLRIGVVKALHARLLPAVMDVYAAFVTSKSTPESDVCEEAWFQLAFDIKYFSQVLALAPAANPSDVLLHTISQNVDAVNWSAGMSVIDKCVADSTANTRHLFACHAGVGMLTASSSSSSGDASSVMRVPLIKECDRFVLLPVSNTQQQSQSHHHHGTNGTSSATSRLDVGAAGGYLSSGRSRDSLVGAENVASKVQAGVMKYLSWGS
eukprot:PhM_4_TR17069/c0_g1_i1/m.30830